MFQAIELKLVHMIPPRLPHDKSRTFDEATEVVAISENSYKVNLRADWSLGPRVFGGYLIGAILRASQEHCVRGQRRHHSTPGSWTIQFLESPDIGEADIKIETLRESPASTFLRCELWQGNRLCVAATTLQVDLESTQNRGLKLPPANMPQLPFASLRSDRQTIDEKILIENGWQTVNMGKVGHQLYSDKPDIKFYFPPGTDLFNSKHIVHPTLGPSFRDQWWTLGKKCLITPANLPLILDLFSTVHVSFPAGANYFTTSESMSCEMRRVCPDQGWEWVFCRSQMMECSGGKYVAHVTVWDTDGQIVALAKMVNVLMSLKKLQEQKERTTSHAKL